MNRKGIMLEFLVTVILALLIFTPTCIFTSKFFRISQQAGENFHLFVDELEAFVQDEQRLSKTAVLIMDEETVIIGFNENKPVVTCVEAPSLLLCKKWEAPGTPECKDSCICLIRKMQLEEDTLLGKTTYQSATCIAWEHLPFSTQSFSQKVPTYDYSIVAQTWVLRDSAKAALLDEPEESVTLRQTTSNGFFLARRMSDFMKIVDTFGILASTAYDVPVAGSLQFSSRRNPVYLQKRDGKLFLCGDEACHDASVTKPSATKP